MDNYLFLMKKCMCKDDFQISIHKKKQKFDFQHRWKKQIKNSIF